MGLQMQQAKGFALAALIAGIVAFLIGWIPVVGLFAGGAAIALGIVAIVKKQPKGLGIAGVALGGVAVIASIGMTVALVGSIVNPPTETAAAPVPSATQSVPEEAPTAVEETTPEPVAPEAPALTPADAEALWLEMHGISAPTDFITMEGYSSSLENPLYAIVPGWGGSTDGWLEITVQETLTRDSVKRLGANVLNFVGPEFPDVTGIVFTDSNGRDYNFNRRDAPLAG